ncbi:hypothetical protein K435DRAFT_857183 [Dendrothele bispora CBS 962.96]|uniref:Uncharacterized protein n=1 Tax=Dendrothele bispora (strain CBS 962.96) TaxID=1314807 RepID=A0A4S8M6E3_DENBC|nr:hypothetical protein K435DRAFT_857183 [Dendrothele bispora CBS 962.96]
MAPVAKDILPQHPRFQLNASGLAGFFGGDEAIAAMNTAQYYQGRRFLGFYNSPGGFRMAKHYGRLAKSRIWRGLYPDASLEPNELFNLGMRGVDFVSVYSAPNRKTRPVKVTIVKLGDTDPPEGGNGHCPPLRRLDVLWFNAATVLASLAACIISGLSEDWYAFSLILLGIVANGVTCLVLGSGKITVEFANPPQGTPPGDGLMTMGDDVIIVLGKEGQTSRITRGSISVEFPAWVKWNDYFVVGACCLLLMLQLLVQIFLIPQATLFGQILFLCSFGVSFLCNTYLSAIDKGDLQREILGDKVWKVGNDAMKGYEFQNWTTMAIAMLYVLRPPKGGAEKQLLKRLLPNQTPEWKAFKRDLLVAYRDEVPKGAERDKARDVPSTSESPLVRNMYTDWQDASESVKTGIIDCRHYSTKGAGSSLHIRFRFKRRLEDECFNASSPPTTTQLVRALSCASSYGNSSSVDDRIRSRRREISGLLAPEIQCRQDKGYEETETITGRGTFREYLEKEKEQMFDDIVLGLKGISLDSGLANDAGGMLELNLVPLARKIRQYSSH